MLCGSPCLGGESFENISTAEAQSSTESHRDSEIRALTILRFALRSVPANIKLFHSRFTIDDSRGDTGGQMINQDRIKNLLLELVQIDSHSRKERDVAERIKKHCEQMG